MGMPVAVYYSCHPGTPPVCNFPNEKTYQMQPPESGIFMSFYLVHTLLYFFNLQILVPYCYL